MGCLYKKGETYKELDDAASLRFKKTVANFEKGGTVIDLNKCSVRFDGRTENSFEMGKVLDWFTVIYEDKKAHANTTFIVERG